MLRKCVDKIPLLITSLMFVGMIIVAILANRDQAAYLKFLALYNNVKVIAPDEGRPTANQESIDSAMEIYAIKSPQNTKWPLWDGELEDRGLTAGGLILSDRYVYIGPAAFTSWGMLGSTLAHEIEVHCNQSFLKIITLDGIERSYLSARNLIGNFIPAIKPSVKEVFERGTWRAERDAYQYELKSAKRFGLKEREVFSISHVMSMYYPAASQEQIKLSADKPHETEKRKEN